LLAATLPLASHPQSMAGGRKTRGGGGRS
jgi:hypothetical protein